MVLLSETMCLLTYQHEKLKSVKHFKQKHIFLPHFKLLIGLPLDDCNVVKHLYYFQRLFFLLQKRPLCS